MSARRTGTPRITDTPDPPLYVPFLNKWLMSISTFCLHCHAESNSAEPGLSLPRLPCLAVPCRGWSSLSQPLPVMHSPSTTCRACVASPDLAVPRSVQPCHAAPADPRRAASGQATPRCALPASPSHERSVPFLSPPRPAMPASASLAKRGRACTPVRRLPRPAERSLGDHCVAMPGQSRPVPRRAMPALPNRA